MGKKKKKIEETKEFTLEEFNELMKNNIEPKQKPLSDEEKEKKNLLNYGRKIK